MSSTTSPKMSPVARQFIDQIIGLSAALNAQTEAEALIEKRKAAEQCLLSQGLPTRKDEDWQYTSIQSLLQQTFRLNDATSEMALTLERIAPYLPEFDTIRLVFVDGEFSESLSAGFDYIPDGLSIEMADADAIQSINLPETADAFQWMNELLLDQGLTLQLDDRVMLEVPIHILYLQTQTETVYSPRLELYLGQAAQCQLMQHYVSFTDDPDVWVNAVTQIDLEADAYCRQIVLQELSPSSFYFNHQTVNQAETSKFDSSYLALGSQISRHHSVANQQGDAAETIQDSVIPGQCQQLLDIRTLTRHQALHGQSRQLHKMVLSDMSRGVFAGMIEVAKGAQKTDGQMDVKSLLLSPQAKVDAKPQLEIYADDVKCSHGCAAGQIDEDQLFYAQARGIRRSEAIQLITQAFLLEPLEKYQTQPALKTWLTQRVVNKR